MFPVVALITAQAPAPLSLSVILEQHLKAMGPFRKVQTRRVRMRALGMAPFELPILTEAQRPNLLRKEVTIQGQAQVTVFDGREAWKLDPFVPGGNAPLPLTAEERRALNDEIEFDPILANASAKGHPITYLCADRVKGRPVHVLKVALKDGGEVTLSLDAASFLEVKRVQKQPVLGRPMDVETYISDYRTVNGMPIPHRMDILIQGIPPMQLLVDAVELNVPLEAKRFARPSR
jgi:hypothetical protein